MGSATCISFWVCSGSVRVVFGRYSQVLLTRMSRRARSLRWLTRTTVLLTPQAYKVLQGAPSFTRDCVGSTLQIKWQDPTPSLAHPGLKQGPMDFISQQFPFTPTTHPPPTHPWKQPNNTESPGPPKEWELAAIKSAPPALSPPNHDVWRA